MGLLKKKEESTTEKLPEKQDEVIAPAGNFTLSKDEMTLSVNALAVTEEYQLYQKILVGSRIAKIIDSYNTAMAGKDESLPTADDDKQDKELQ